MATSYLNLMIK